MKRICAVILVFAISLGMLVSCKRNDGGTVKVEYFWLEESNLVSQSATIEDEDAQAMIRVLEQTGWESPGGLNCRGDYDITYHENYIRYHRFCDCGQLEDFTSNTRLELTEKDQERLNNILDRYF